MPPAPEQHYRETYRATDLEKLISDFDIPEEHRESLPAFLEDVAAIWRSHQHPPTAKIRPAVTSAALQMVSKLADQLNTALRDLPPPAKAALDTAYSRLDGKVILAMSDDQPPPKGVAFNVAQADGAPLIVKLEQDEIQDLVANISAMAAQAADLPSGKAGTKRDHGLRMWMTNVEMFWTKTLGRNFSRDVTSNGEAVSEAARFCVAAFAPVSAETLPSRVLQEMKLCIKTARKKSTGRIAPQIDA